MLHTIVSNVSLLFGDGTIKRQPIRLASSCDRTQPLSMKTNNFFFVCLFIHLLLLAVKPFPFFTGFHCCSNDDRLNCAYFLSNQMQNVTCGFARVSAFEHHCQTFILCVRVIFFFVCFSLPPFFIRHCAFILTTKFHEYVFNNCTSFFDSDFYSFSTECKNFQTFIAHTFLLSIV